MTKILTIEEFEALDEKDFKERPAVIFHLCERIYGFRPQYIVRVQSAFPSRRWVVENCKGKAFVIGETDVNHVCHLVFFERFDEALHFSLMFE
jgi:hypothetical protein